MALPGTYTNRQVRGPCYLCIKVVKWVPVLFILSIVFWSYYAFVIQLCFFTIHSLIQKILYLFIYHILFVMFVWAYFQTIFTTRGSLPNRFRLSDSEVDRIMHAENEDMQNVILERFARDLPTHNRTINNTVRYCDKCRHVKPDRAHHCSVCGECILKMDHHCPWVNNCVCYKNYKFFLLFLGYALVYCIFVSLASMQYFIAFWKQGPRETTDKSSGALDGVDGMGRFHILFLFFVAVMFAISLASLFFYHIYLVSVNRTTLEAFRSPIFYNGPDKDGYNLGTRQNFVEVFGENSNLWFLPIFSASGDGVIYPVRTQQPSGSYQTMENSQTSLGDGIVYEKRHTLEDMEELLYDCDTRSEVDIE